MIASAACCICARAHGSAEGAARRHGRGGSRSRALQRRRGRLTPSFMRCGWTRLSERAQQPLARRSSVAPQSELDWTPLHAPSCSLGHPCMQQTTTHAVVRAHACLPCVSCLPMQYVDALKDLLYDVEASPSDAPGPDVLSAYKQHVAILARGLRAPGSPAFCRRAAPGGGAGTATANAAGRAAPPPQQSDARPSARRGRRAGPSGRRRSSRRQRRGPVRPPNHSSSRSSSGCLRSAMPQRRAYAPSSGCRDVRLRRRMCWG